MKKIKECWLFILTIIILVFVILYLSYLNIINSKERMSFENARKCSTYLSEFKKEINDITSSYLSPIVIVDPGIFYSKKLNTCISYAGFSTGLSIRSYEIKNALTGEMIEHKTFKSDSEDFYYIKEILNEKINLLKN